MICCLLFYFFRKKYFLQKGLLSQFIILLFSFYLVRIYYFRYSYSTYLFELISLTNLWESQKILKYSIFILQFSRYVKTYLKDWTHSYAYSQIHYVFNI